MFLEIQNVDGIDDAVYFVGWLTDRITEYALNTANMNPALMKLWDEYFKENDLGWVKDSTDTPIPPSTSYIISEYFTNLVIDQPGNSFIITTDPDNMLRNTGLAIDTLAAIINNGNLSTKAYPYFDEVFDYFADNIDSYYAEWRELNVPNTV